MMETDDNYPIEIMPETIVLMSESEAEEIEGGKGETGSCRTKTCDYTNQDIYYL
jgi:hypothetical protein